MIPLGDRAIEFSATIAAYAFFLVFAVLGALATGFGIHSFLTEGDKDLIMMILVGPIFSLVGIVGFLRVLRSKVIFDKKTDTLYSQSAGSGINPFGVTTQLTSLDEIYAVQVISELVTGDDHDYHSYELNLVLKDSSRINIIDHGDGQQVIKDALVLSNFLGVHFWNAVPK